MTRHEPTGEPLTMRRGFFWVGVQTRAQSYGTVPYGQMYTEWLAPVAARRPHPIILVHGGGGQGLDWLGTPDGRPGWATSLVEEGFVVYVVDRPGHGRSPYHPDLLGPMTAPAPYELIQQIFTPGDEPPAQWPGGRHPGDKVMDQFMAGTGPLRADGAAAHALEQACLAELLDRVGPAIVFSHSAGGPAGWLAADARPELVAALVAIEPVGPPFAQIPPLGLSLDWGLTAAPLVFDPPLTDPSPLRGGPPRRLANLSRVATAVVTSDVSMATQSDAHVIAFLEQFGCTPDHLRLTEHGLHGNGHGMMLERNNREVLDVPLRWLEDRGVA